MSQPQPSTAHDYALAIIALREKGIRTGKYRPITDDERRQAAEGDRHWSELDCVRQA